MFFKDVLADSELKQKLIDLAREGRIPHAQLFLAQPGSHALALAIALGQYLSCENPGEHDSCGVCPSCKQYANLAHPDLHLYFPNCTTKSVPKDPQSSLLINEFRDYVLESDYYVDINEWLGVLDGQNKQPSINIRDCSDILRHNNTYSHQNGYKVYILWCADRLHHEAAPKILKTLEKYEIPATFFVIDYGSDPEKISIMKRALKDGCTIGIHGYSHDYSKIYASTDDFINNITTLHEKLKADLNYDPFILRFPGGSSNTVSKDYCKGIMTQLTKQVQKENYYYSDWNVDSTDASGNNVPVKKLIASVEENCDPETYNIILMHDSDAKGTTAKALPKIIEWAQEEGYVFKAMAPGSPTVHHRVNN